MPLDGITMKKRKEKKLFPFFCLLSTKQQFTFTIIYHKIYNQLHNY